MLRDVDLSGCYANVMAGMHLYAGRPVVHDPGRTRAGRPVMTMRQAVAFLRAAQVEAILLSRCNFSTGSKIGELAWRSTSVGIILFAPRRRRFETRNDKLGSPNLLVAISG